MNDTDVGVPAEAQPEPSGPDATSSKFKVRLANFEGPFDLLLQLVQTSNRGFACARNLCHRLGQHSDNALQFHTLRANEE